MERTKIGPYETGRIYRGDCLELMGNLPDNSIDTICTDPPYGLSDGTEDIGKVLVSTFFDVVLPDYKQLIPTLGDQGEFPLPRDRISLLRLMDRTVWEKSAVAMPEGAVDFNDRVVFWDEEVEDANVSTNSVTGSALIEKLDAASCKEGPYLFLNLRPSGNAAFRDGSCGGLAQLGNGRLTVPVVIPLDSYFAGFLCTLSPSGPGFLTDLIRIINDPTGKAEGAAFVMTSSGAELRAMLTFDLAGETIELLPASSAAEPDFVFELRCAKRVGARPTAGRLASVFQTYRVCVVGDAANRTCSLCLHTSIVSQTRKRRGGFMGKNWDHGVPGIPFWSEALRVAKPGAILLAFGGTRTSHRLACAIEDAGWEIRDCIMWVYGSG